MSDCGFASIPRTKVIASCERFVRIRRARIDRDREAAVVKIMSDRKYFFFGPKHTREEAIDLLKGDIWSEWYLAEVRGGMQADAVSDLLTLAYHSQGNVCVPAWLAVALFGEVKTP